MDDNVHFYCIWAFDAKYCMVFTGNATYNWWTILDIYDTFWKEIYWVLGASLGVSAYLLFQFQIQSLGSLLTGAIIEIVFGLLMYFNYRKSNLKLNIVNLK